MATPHTLAPRPHPTAFHFTPADHVGLSVLTDAQVLARFDDCMDDQGDCEVWTGRLTNGQPRFWFATSAQTGREVLAVRLAWARAHGPIPEGHMVRHSCQTRACVKVSHLFLTLPVGNVHETQRQGRWAKSNLTVCPSGHQYEGANLVREMDGSRRCRTCKKTHLRAAYAAHPEKWVARRERRRKETAA